MDRPHPGINIRWKIFSDHLLQGTNATDAYLLAGYRSRNRPSAQAASSRLLRHPRFAVYHRKIRRQIAAQSRRHTLRTITRKLRLLRNIILTSASSVPPRNQALIEYQKNFRHGGRVTRLPCKLTALQQHLKLSGQQDVNNHLPSSEGPTFLEKTQPTITFTILQSKGRKMASGDLHCVPTGTQCLVTLDYEGALCFPETEVLRFLPSRSATMRTHLP
jgi:hypothetical protein